MRDGNDHFDQTKRIDLEVQRGLKVNYLLECDLGLIYVAVTKKTY